MSRPGPEFVALVKDALEHLYDPVHLREHPLTQLLLDGRSAGRGSTAQEIRQALLDCIDVLKPDCAVPEAGEQRRDYQILELRYVQALPFRPVMSELGLSQTQYHKHQRHAVEAVATILWERGSTRSMMPSEETDEPLGGLAFPQLHPTAVTDGATDLVAVGRGVLGILRPLAEDRQVILRDELPSRPIVVPVDRTKIRQLLIAVLSRVLTVAASGQLVLTSQQGGGRVRIVARYEGDLVTAPLHTSESTDRMSLAEMLAQSLGGGVAIEWSSKRAIATAWLPYQDRSVLILDDNPDMVQLMTRYVADHNYAVLSASNVPDGVELARSAQPDVIVLDVMIPRQDGWDALQALKRDAVTRDIPVIVCTILGESQLARSLGATEFIRKPVTRDTFLAALAHCAR